ncbi:MAG: hypothetical protein ACOX87_06580 [Chloroflexota bacterium]|jgi:hypothetical protein
MSTSDRADAERFAEALDLLLDGRPIESIDEDIGSLLDVARQLQREAVEGEPDPAFTARLREELVGKEAVGSGGRPVPDLRVVQSPRAHWRWGLRAACALFALAVAALLLQPWGGRDAALEADLDRLPPLLDVASAYAEQLGAEAQVVIDNATFKLGAKLPKPPERVRVYRQVREPVDEVGARGLANRLGISNPIVIDEPHTGVLEVTGNEGRLVVSRDFRSYFSFAASDGEVGVLGDAGTRGQGEVMRVAEEFLRARGLLEFEHLVETVDDAPPGATPLYRQVVFTPTLESRPVRGLGVVVTVGPEEKITAVQSTYATLVPADLYPITSAEDAYERLKDGRPDLLQVRKQGERGSSAAGFSSMSTRAVPTAGDRRQEELPPYQFGEVVELEGLLSALVFQSRDGSRRYEATLLAGPRESRTVVQFKLLGSAIEELSRLDQQHVRVRGRVEALSARPTGGSLRVEQYEKLYPEERLVALLGRLEIVGEGGLVLVADDGQSYWLERPAGAPPPLERSGQRAIVEGRTTERTSKDELPVLELVSVQGGTDIDRMADLSGYQRQRPQVVPEHEPLVTGDVDVEQAALEYYARPAVVLQGFVAPNPEPFLLVQPVYSFSGSFEGGDGHFEAQIQAVRPEYVDGSR